MLFYMTRSTQTDLVLDAVLPEVLVLWPAGHDGAALLGADLDHGAVEQLDPVEEVHHVHGQPVVETIVRRLLHSLRMRG